MYLRCQLPGNGVCEGDASSDGGGGGGQGQADRLVSGRTPTDLKCLLLNVCCDTRGCFPVSTAQT